MLVALPFPTGKLLFRLLLYRTHFLLLRWWLMLFLLLPLLVVLPVLSRGRPLRRGNAFSGCRATGCHWNWLSTKHFSAPLIVTGNYRASKLSIIFLFSSDFHRIRMWGDVSLNFTSDSDSASASRAGHKSTRERDGNSTELRMMLMKKSQPSRR